MRADDSIFLIDFQHTSANTFKMTKTRTAMFLGVFVFACCVILSITDAYPTPEAEPFESDAKLGNNSRLVITNVVKTIEFEVGIVDDDGVVDENSTDTNVTDFYETDIELLNVDLLKAVVDQANEEESRQTTTEPESSDEPEQPAPNLLFPLNVEA